VLGRVGGTSLDDGGAPPGVEAPIYAVAAVQAGRSSPPTRSDGPVLSPAAQAGPPPADPAPVPVAPPPVPRTPGPTGTPPADAGAGAEVEVARPTGVRAVRLPDGAVEVSWAGPPGAQFRVRVRTGADAWRVVGRTTATSLEDGGAPAGDVPVYAVSATVGGVRSDEGRSDAAE